MRRGRARGGFARRTPMASAPCHLLELPTAVLLLIADAASHRSVGRLAQASHLCWAQLCADLVTKRIPYIVLAWYERVPGVTPCFSVVRALFRQSAAVLAAHVVALVSVRQWKTRTV